MSRSTHRQRPLRVRRASVAQAILAAIAAAGTFGALSGCYGPTEIRLAVTTPASQCAAIQTQIFTGRRGDPAFGTVASAEADGCGPDVPGEPRIGTITVVPSGSRDGQFDLEVVAGVGVRADTCRANNFTSCIIARRHVSFRPHESLPLPVLLSDRCLGVVCNANGANDQTCDLGKCVSLDQCGDSGCPREQADAGPVDAQDGSLADGPPADAPLADAPPSDGPPSICGTTPEVIVDGQAILGQLVLDGTDFVYANVPDNGATMGEVRRVSRIGAGVQTHTVVTQVPNLTAVTAAAGGIAWAASDGMQLLLGRRMGNVVDLSGLPATGTADAIAFSDATTIVGFVNDMGTGPRPFRWSLAVLPVATGVPLSAPVSELLLDPGANLYGITATGSPFRYTANPGAPAIFYGSITTPSAPYPDIAITKDTLYVGLGSASVPTGIHAIAFTAINDAYTGVPWIKGVSPRSLATDGTSLWFLSGTVLSVTPVAAGPAITPLVTNVSPNAERLQVDDTCVYWVETAPGSTKGARIMRRAKQ